MRPSAGDSRGLQPTRGAALALPPHTGRRRTGTIAQGHFEYSNPTGSTASTSMAERLGTVPGGPHAWQLLLAHGGPTQRVTLHGCMRGTRHVLLERAVLRTTPSMPYCHFASLLLAGSAATLSGAQAAVPPWLDQGEASTEGTPAASTQPTGTTSGTGGTQAVDCASQTANKSASELGSKTDSQTDLFPAIIRIATNPGALGTSH